MRIIWHRSTRISWHRIKLKPCGDGSVFSKGDWHSILKQTCTDKGPWPPRFTHSPRINLFWRQVNQSSLLKRRTLAASSLSNSAQSSRQVWSLRIKPCSKQTNYSMDSRFSLHVLDSNIIFMTFSSEKCYPPRSHEGRFRPGFFLQLPLETHWEMLFQAAVLIRLQTFKVLLFLLFFAVYIRMFTLALYCIPYL